jgi:hypothetical protein
VSKGGASVSSFEAKAKDRAHSRSKQKERGKGTMEQQRVGGEAAMDLYLTLGTPASSLMQDSNSESAKAV